MSVTVESIEFLGAECSTTEAQSSPRNLGPMDHLVPHIVPIANVFVYSNGDNCNSNGIISAGRFRQALRRALNYYPHLTGRFGYNTDRTLHLTSLDKGVGWYTAVCSSSLSLFMQNGKLEVTNLPDCGNALMAPYNLSEFLSTPLLTVQYTRFACGSVCIGFRVSHCLCDSDGYFQLYKDIVSCYNHPNIALPLPHIQSFLGADIDSSGQQLENFKPLMFELANLQEGESFISPSADEVQFPVEVIGKVLRFSAKELQQIKDEANEHSVSWVSTFEALAAHLYQRIYLARVELATKRGFNTTEHISKDILTPINWRGESRLNLPPKYFPNAAVTTTMTLPSDILTHGPLSEIASLLHKRLRILSPTDVLATLQWISSQPDKTRIIPKFQFVNGGFMISQWSKFDMYRNVSLDGLNPILVSPPFTQISLIDGLGYVLATEDQLSSNCVNECSIDLNIALDKSVWEILEHDKLFRRISDLTP